MCIFIFFAKTRLYASSQCVLTSSIYKPKVSLLVIALPTILGVNATCIALNQVHTYQVHIDLNLF